MKENESIWIRGVGTVGAVSSAVWFVVIIFVKQTSDGKIPWVSDYKELVGTTLMTTSVFGIFLGIVTLVLISYHRWKHKKWHGPGLLLSLVALWPLILFLMVH